MQISKIGFIGLGNMGFPIALNILQAGYELFVFNRTKDAVIRFQKESELLDCKKIGVAAKPKDLHDCDLVFIMVSDAAAIRDVLFSENNSGLFSGSSREILPKVVINMSTIAPYESLEIANTVSERGSNFLDAPVSGGTKAARDKELVVFVGGEKEVYNDVQSVFPTFAKRSYYIGKSGMGCFMKMITVANLASILLGLSESLTLAKKAGINKELVVEILNQTVSNRSGLSESKGISMARGDFVSTFSLELMNKDLKLLQKTCEQLNLSLPVAQTISKLYGDAFSKGYGKMDFTAIQVYEEKEFAS
jgi:3-hydroxyisobutyrate dehydrogenase